MILLDTNVIIRFWRSNEESLRVALAGNDLAICDVTRCELLHGARNEDDLVRIAGALQGFRYLPIDTPVWDALGHNLYRLRKAGVAVPFQDALIATAAIRHGAAVWSFDAHFELMRKVLGDLRLFVLPSS